MVFHVKICALIVSPLLSDLFMVDLNISLKSLL